MGKLYLFTSECTISLSNFQNFIRLRRQGGIDPLTKILRTFLQLLMVTMFEVGHIDPYLRLLRRLTVEEPLL